jgi:hypothetical protein
MTKDFETLISTSKKSIGKGISLRLVRSKNAKAELAIIVGDAATAEDLRKAWPIIDRARTEIRQVQGSPMNRIDNALIFSYGEMRILGKWSYEFIAQDINFDVLVNLVRAVTQVPEGATPDSQEGYVSAYVLLKTMRMKDSDIRSWLAAGVEVIERGEAPWSVDRGPVTAARVREALRQFERDLESGKIVIKEAPKTATVSVSEIAAKNDEVISKAEALLKRSYPKPFQRYQNYMLKKVRESVKPRPSNAGKSG